MNPLNKIKTIRLKLFLTFFLSIILLIALGLFMNTFFLESYYITQNESAFIEADKTISNEYDKGKNSMEVFVEKYGKENDFSIEIIQKNHKIEFSSIAKTQFGESLPNEIEALIIESAEQIDSAYIYDVAINEREDQSTAKLVYITKLSKHHDLVLSKPLKGIRESVAITNRFALLTGVITIIFGGLLTSLISKKATGPILKMSKVAEQISELDFSSRVNVSSEDEIALLGKSMNTISDKLSISIDTLTTDIERRKRLVRDISHELKTPIGVIKGYSEGIKYGVADSPEMVDKYIETIILECNQMDIMIQEMIELSRYEYCEKELEINEIKGSLIINTIEERFTPLFEEADVNFQTYNDSDVSLYADFNLLIRALSNYLTNALKHMDENKIIKMSIESIEDTILFSVYNSGQNIPQKDIERVWDIFYKSDVNQSNKGKVGSGLGLSIVKQIAVLHGGSVDIENLEDGVKFYLKLSR